MISTRTWYLVNSVWLRDLGGRLFLASIVQSVTEVYFITARYALFEMNKKLHKHNTEILM